MQFLIFLNSIMANTRFSGVIKLNLVKSVKSLCGFREDISFIQK